MGPRRIAKLLLSAISTQMTAAHSRKNPLTSVFHPNLPLDEVRLQSFQMVVRGLGSGRTSIELSPAPNRHERLRTSANRRRRAASSSPNPSQVPTGKFTMSHSRGPRQAASKSIQIAPELPMSTFPR